MLTAVFSCQAWGQIAATFVAFIATAAQKHNLPADATAQNCNDQCIKTLDGIWRWIIGVGVIPAVIALWFRLTIIESPRYTADVLQDTRKAATELSRYMVLQAEGAVVSASSFQIPNGHPSHPMRRRSVASSGMLSNAESGAISEGTEIRESRGPSPFDSRRFEESGRTNTNGAPKEIITVKQAVSEIHPHRSASPVAYSDIEVHQHEEDLEDARLGTSPEHATPPAPSWKDFKQYFWHDGNLRTLIAASFCWFCKY